MCTDCLYEEEGKLTLLEMFYYVGIPVLLFFVGVGIAAYVFRRKWLHKVQQRLMTSRGGTKVRDPNGSILSKILMLVNFFQVCVCFVCACVCVCARASVCVCACACVNIVFGRAPNGLGDTMFSFMRTLRFRTCS